jgi:sugar lactone lactonase YvrE
MEKRTVLILLILASFTGFLVTELASAKVSKNTFNGVGKVLVQGAPIHGANGIMFDAEDRLHIASVVGREILIMDPRSGRILDRLGTEDGVEGPDDLAFGPDGSLYWTSILTGFVGRRAPDGTVTQQFVAVGVNPITFSDDGRLFVALDFLGDGLYELDPELIDGPFPIIEATLGNPFPLGFLNGMDWGPDGRLYGPLWVPGLVVRIDVDTAEVEVVASSFVNPAAVKFDSQGNLHVADQFTGEIARVDTSTGEKEVVATGLCGLDNIAFDSRDRLFVSHAQDGSIHQVLPSGRVRTVSKGGIIVPGGVAVMPRGRGRESVFVADLFALREFDGRTGRPLSVERHDLTIVEPVEITSPFTVSTAGEYLVLSSWFGNEVQVWDPETRQVLENYHEFMVPLNAIEFQDEVVVAELLTGSVVRASDGATLASGLFVPVGLAATEDDLYIGDWASGMVWKIGDPDLVPVAMGLSFPEGLAVGRDGSLLVVETLITENGPGRLSRIDPETGAVSVIVPSINLGTVLPPEGYPPTGFFNGVAVGPSGNIYVTGDTESVLYRFKPTR